MVSSSLRRFAFVAFALSAGCNLLSGASDLVAEEEEEAPSRPETGPPPVPEASLPPKLEKDANDEGPDPNAIDGGDAGRARPEGGLFTFVTSTTVGASLNGWVDADAECMKLAIAAGLGGQGVAFLSKQGNAGKAVDRLAPTGAYYLVDGITLVGSSRQPIGNDNLAHPIDRDENGALVEATVWTGSRGGTYFYGNCSDWTNTATNPGGVIGQSKAKGQDWSSSAPAACNSKQRLYCFER